MRRGGLAGAAVAIVLVGCGGDVVQPGEHVLFTIEVSGETFRTLVSDRDVIDALDARRRAGTQGVILGSLVSGHGGFNAPWSWHWAPGTVEVADAAIELCDGRPSMVEDDIAYWIGTVGAFCPWGAKVLARDPAGDGE